MKRSMGTVAIFGLLAFLSGCGPDTHEGLVQTTINMIQGASTNIGLITDRVAEAAKKAQAGKKLDLSEAMEQCKQLKTVGEQAQKLKREIEQVRSKVTEDERKSAAQKYAEPLSTAFTELIKKKDDLRAELAKAEAINTQAKTAVRELREKIAEAEAPFEALARQFPGPEPLMIRSIGIFIGAIGLFMAVQGSAYEEALKQAIDSFDKIGAKLKTINNEDSANAARADLRKSADAFVEARAKAAKLDPPEKDEKARLEKQFKAKLDESMKKMQLEIRRVDAIPGGKEALKEISGVFKKDEK